MQVLVTAGPTREPLDPVRYLTNRSSGRMGYSIARALRDRGDRVILVSGPVKLRPPKGVKVVSVETAREMLAACREHWERSKALVATAAVADFRPAQYSTAKKKRGASEKMRLDLVANPDILATLARRKGSRVVVGFALETGDGSAEARRKLHDKRLDWIALNGPEAQGAERAKLRIFGADGSEQVIGPSRKDALARSLVRLVFGAATRRR